MAFSEFGRCSYLFHQSRWEQDHLVPPHAHRFWQLEINLAGTITAQVQRQQVAIPIGGGLLIPAGQIHEFTGHGRPCHFLSLKFMTTDSCAAPWAYHLVGQEAGRRLLGVLVSLIPSGFPLGEVQRSAVGDVLSALLTVELHPADGVAGGRQRPGEELVAQVTQYIESKAVEGLTVQAVAEHFGYTSRHLSERYRRSVGRSLKQAIDQARAQHAGHLLDYSRQTITGVAESLNFADVYAFSRFFRRMRGRSPSEWRNRPERPELLIMDSA